MLRRDILLHNHRTRNSVFPEISGTQYPEKVSGIYRSLCTTRSETIPAAENFAIPGYGTTDNAADNLAEKRSSGCLDRHRNSTSGYRRSCRSFSHLP
jgi:hypothetical protein